MARAGDGGDRSDKRKRNKIIQKRVTDGEMRAFIERAHEAGFDDHRDYLSTLIFGDAFIQQTERSALIRVLGELGKHGSNLNQLSKSVNKGRAKVLSKADLQTIIDARAAVDGLAAQIKEVLK